MADQTFDSEIVAQDCAKAPLNPRWAFKLGIITFVVFIVGAWGYWDASSVYPNRGIRYADWAKWQYLEQGKLANSEDFGIFIRDSSVPNPVEELERLQEPETKTRNLTDAGNSSSSRHLRASMLVARLNWLEALKVVGMLDAEHTVFESPDRERDALVEKWRSASVPKPLHNLDLIVQWMIMAICWFIALLMFVHILKVRMKRYAWDAGSMTLTLPGGQSITPDDLEEVDKRKWDKYIVFLKLKSSHVSLADKEVAVDTYQRKFIEDWILAMEDKAFGSQEEADAATPESQAQESAGDNENA